VKTLTLKSTTFWALGVLFGGVTGAVADRHSGNLGRLFVSLPFYRAKLFFRECKRSFSPRNSFPSKELTGEPFRLLVLLDAAPADCLSRYGEGSRP
jgi:hypothetical protein